MKLLKVVAMLGLSSLLAMNTAQAAGKPQPKQKQTQKRESALDQFNKSVNINFVSRGLQMGANNQPVITLTYNIQNRGSSPIKSVLWVSGFQVDNVLFYTRETPVNFEPALQAGQQLDVTIGVPVSELPRIARPLFSDKEMPIQAIIGAKNLAFGNGKKIVVAQ